MKPGINLWDFSVKYEPGNSNQRGKCSRILNFICARNYKNVWIKKKDREDIKDGFIRNEHILYRWSVSSPFVDYIGKKLYFDWDDLSAFLQRWGFNADCTYNPDRYSRKDWFFEVIMDFCEDEEIVENEKDEEIVKNEQYEEVQIKFLTDEKGRHYVLSDTGVKVFVDFRDNLIIDKDDPVIVEQGRRWKYTNGLVKGLSYLGSENSEDTLTWNTFRILMKISVPKWFNKIFPSIKLTEEEYKGIKFRFWKEFLPPLERPVKEGKTHVDLAIETPEKLIFIEVKYKSEISLNTTYDNGRDQIIRNIDVCSRTAKESGKDFYFILLTPKANIASINKLTEYKNNPGSIKEKIGSYRKDVTDYNSLAGHIDNIYWEDIKSVIKKDFKKLKDLQDYLDEKFPEE